MFSKEPNEDVLDQFLDPARDVSIVQGKENNNNVLFCKERNKSYDLQVTIKTMDFLSTNIEMRPHVTNGLIKILE